jgi:hypothetical protein
VPEFGLGCAGKLGIPHMGQSENPPNEIADNSRSPRMPGICELCIGSFGPSPLDPEPLETASEGTSGSGSTCSKAICSTRTTGASGIEQSWRLEFESNKEIETEMAGKGSERSISVVHGITVSKQADASDVGSNRVRQWLFKEGSQSSFSSVSFQPPCSVTRKDSRGTGCRFSKQALRKRFLTKVADSLAPVGSEGGRGWGWEEEVGPFF